MESLTDAYFASALDICGFGNGRGVSGEMRNDGLGETPRTDVGLETAEVAVERFGMMVLGYTLDGFCV